MSGIPIARAKFLAYLLAGLLSSIAGLLLSCITYSGEANSLLGGGYTLSSIASVVIGGTSLFGGSGGAIGSIFGAFVLRTIGDLLLVFDLDPLWHRYFSASSCSSRSVSAHSDCCVLRTNSISIRDSKTRCEAGYSNVLIQWSLRRSAAL